MHPALPHYMFKLALLSPSQYFFVYDLIMVSDTQYPVEFFHDSPCHLLSFADIHGNQGGEGVVQRGPAPETNFLH